MEKHLAGFLCLLAVSTFPYYFGKWDLNKVYRY